jgi:hypothetical protein
MKHQGRSDINKLGSYRYSWETKGLSEDFLMTINKAHHLSKEKQQCIGYTDKITKVEKALLE